jgi:hypothetical protein
MGKGGFLRRRFRNGRPTQLDRRSFKTFCTPLRLPYPVQIEQGTKLSQSVTLRLEGTVPTLVTHIYSLGTTARYYSIVTKPNCAALPPLGLGVASHTET